RTQPIPGCEQWLHMGGGADPMAVRDTARTASSILWDGFDVWVHLAGHRVDVDTDRAALAQLGEPVESDPPLLPPHRWSRRPAEALSVAPAIGGSFVAEIGVGVVHAERPDEPRLPDRRLLELQRRVKLELDPDGRLGPGRRPECR
ncbi:MAG: FAD-linked oxidase C-terminal domain-containing protein, partial [Acidimicrobiales bacterium]